MIVHQHGCGSGPSIGGRTADDAPLKVTATRNKKGGVTIAWEAEADFESGIHCFIIERDGKQIGQVPENPIGRFGRPLFQSMSYHDTPQQPLPKMQLVDKNAQAGGLSIYRVRTVNSVGQKSEPAVSR